MINDPLKYVAVPFAELQALLEMARNVSKNSPWGQTDTQPWNPEIKQLAELGSEVPTIAGVVGESNTVLISIPDLDMLRSMLPVIGPNYNWWVNGVDTGVPVFADATMVMRAQILIRAPIIESTTNLDEIKINAGGVITVDNGVDKVLKVDIPETTINIAGAAMLVVDIAGNVQTSATTAPVPQCAPLLYINRQSGYIVNVLEDISYAITGTELPYITNNLKFMDVNGILNLLSTINGYKDYIDGINNTLTNSLNTLSNTVDGLLSFNTQQSLNDDQLVQLWANAGIGSTQIDFAASFTAALNS